MTGVKKASDVVDGVVADAKSVFALPRDALTVQLYQRKGKLTRAEQHSLYRAQRRIWQAEAEARAKGSTASDAIEVDVGPDGHAVVNGMLLGAGQTPSELQTLFSNAQQNS